MNEIKNYLVEKILHSKKKDLLYQIYFKFIKNRQNELYTQKKIFEKDGSN
jgi:hypothetical protein